jgi:hypothetical protein
MVTQSTTTVEAKDEKPGKSQLLVIDLDKRHSPKQVKRLRKGHGKLMNKIEGIVEELVEAGTIKSNAQPVVIVVREDAPLPWPFG